jgi:hypothetical protein
MIETGELPRSAALRAERDQLQAEVDALTAPKRPGQFCSGGAAVSPDRGTRPTGKGGEAAAVPGRGAGRAGRWLRARLILLAAVEAAVGGWQYLAPGSFFRDVPAVAADPPFNSHLMTDAGGLNLALAVVLGAAAWRMERTLTRMALTAYLVCSGSHLLFHATDRATLAPGARVLLLTSLGLLPAAAAALLVLAGRAGRPGASSEPGGPGPVSRR